MERASEIEQALNFDSMAEAERITGTNYKQNEGTVWLGLALMQEQRKVTNDLLAEANDTNGFHQTLAQWMAVIEDLGFALVLCDDIPGTDDKYRIWWRDGVLLESDSHGGNRVNGATAYFNYHGPRSAMHKCSSGWVRDTEGEPVWEGSRDAREGLRFALARMEAAGKLLPKWEKRGFLWLLHYMDSKAEGYDYEAITQERISRLPAEVQAALSA